MLECDRQNKTLLSEDWCAILNASFFLSIGTTNTLEYHSPKSEEFMSLKVWILILQYEINYSCWHIFFSFDFIFCSLSYE